MHRELEQSLRADLAAVARMVDVGSDDAVAAVARSEMPRLLRALHALLDAHQPDANGRCPTCRDRRFWRLHYWRRPNVPCRAFLAARLAWTASDEIQSSHSNDRRSSEPAA
ncbi:hypothetical protein ALI22I_23235 [Saccharothrix sp. ALI-22-I]|nr:hypothetical protein ALI22I_23235 [Saccharothrix sp. ALI-22-I]